MFAHQVIDDIQGFIHGASRQPHNNKLVDYINALKWASCGIKQSQQFHIGDQADFYDSMGISNYIKNKSKLFMGEDFAGAELPYPKCWFDARRHTSQKRELSGTYPSRKRGIYAEQIKKGLFFSVVFCHTEEFSKWIMSPFVHIIRMGEALEIEGGITMDNGDVIGSSAGNMFVYPLFPDSELGNKKYKLVREDADELTTIDLVMRLLNCKNIGTQKVNPSAKLNKVRIKRGKQPLFTYHILVLKPTGKKQESISKNLWDNRIHLQRGHFKTYTEENPLFGNITGRFWWQPHVRGQNKNGIVMKDYVIAGPGERKNNA